MAYFLVSAAEAAVVTAATKAAEKSAAYREEERLPFIRKLKWLFNMLWGGSVRERLAWRDPFLTAMHAPADMLNDLFLGLSAVALAMVIWIVVLLAKDPKGVVKGRLFNKE